MNNKKPLILHLEDTRKYEYYNSIYFLCTYVFAPTEAKTKIHKSKTVFIPIHVQYTDKGKVTLLAIRQSVHEKSSQLCHGQAAN